jgi:hypothetical protein
MAIAVAGYSGKPLAEKLGLRDGMAAAFVALPASLAQLKQAAKLAPCESYPDWRAVRGETRFDFVHAFSKLRGEVEEGLAGLQAAIRRDGMIWVSWPKRASKVATDVDENVVRAAALRLDLVDVKIAAVDETWSGLKLVIRKDRR